MLVGYLILMATCHLRPIFNGNFIGRKWPVLHGHSLQQVTVHLSVIQARTYLRYVSWITRDSVKITLHIMHDECVLCPL